MVCPQSGMVLGFVGCGIISCYISRRMLMVGQGINGPPFPGWLDDWTCGR